MNLKILPNIVLKQRITLLECFVTSKFQPQKLSNIYYLSASLNQLLHVIRARMPLYFRLALHNFLKKSIHEVKIYLTLNHLVKVTHTTNLVPAFLWTYSAIHSPQSVQIQNCLMRLYILKSSNAVGYYDMSQTSEFELAQYTKIIKPIVKIHAHIIFAMLYERFISSPLFSPPQ